MAMVYLCNTCRKIVDSIYSGEGKPWITLSSENQDLYGLLKNDKAHFCSIQCFKSSELFIRLALINSQNQKVDNSDEKECSHPLIIGESGKCSKCGIKIGMTAEKECSHIFWGPDDPRCRRCEKLYSEIKNDI